MPLVRLALAIFLLLGTPLHAGEAAAPPPAAEVDAAMLRLDTGLVELAAELTALGLPDARGATLFQGELRLPLTKAEHQALEARGIASHGSSSPGDDDEALLWWGLHLRLRDDTWLAGLGQMLTPAEGVLDLGKAAEVSAGTVPSGQGDDEDFPDRSAEEVAGFSGLDLARLEASAPARAMWSRFRYRTGSPDHAAQAILLLARWGLPHPGRLAIIHAAQEWRQDGPQSDSLELCPNTRFSPSWDPDELESLKARTTAVARDESRVLADPLVLIRRAAGREAIRRLAGGDATVAALARACLPAQGPRIDLLVACTALPTQAAPGDPLAKRLLLWACGDGSWNSDRPVLVDTPETDELRYENDGGRAHRQREASRRIAPAWSDLPALLALAGDRSPSRWVTDRSNQPRVRSIGDNALRAIATIIGCDPRQLIGLDPGMAWDDAARDRVAEGLRAWWAVRADRPRPAILADMANALPLAAIPAFLAGPAGPDRDAKVAALAERLRGPSPPPISRQALAQLLAATIGDAAIAPVAAAWPVEGRQRLVLAAWHRLKGRGEHLERELAESLAGDLDTDAGRARLTEVLSTCRAMPTLGTAALVAAALTGPAERPLLRLLVCTSLDTFSLRMGCTFGSFDPLWPLKQAQADPGGQEARNALDLAIWLRCLDDQRPLAGAPVGFAGGITWGKDHIYQDQPHLGMDSSETRPDLPARSDWRVCDLAAYVAEGVQYNLGLTSPAGFDLFAAPAERDQAIATIRTRSAAVALAVFAKLGWPAPVPAAATDPKSLF